MISTTIRACSAVVLLLTVSTSYADFTVTGVETSPGNYSFLLQGMPGDPIQHRTTGMFEILDFRIDVPGVLIGTPMGTIFDGTNTMTASLFGWTAGPGTFDEFDPGGVNAQWVSLQADPGVPIDTIPWTFVSQENLNGFARSIPEPSVVASCFCLGSICFLGCSRRKRKSVI